MMAYREQTERPADEEEGESLAKRAGLYDYSAVAPRPLSTGARIALWVGLGLLLLPIRSLIEAFSEGLAVGLRCVAGWMVVGVAYAVIALVFNWFRAREESRSFFNAKLARETAAFVAEQEDNEIKTRVFLAREGEVIDITEATCRDETRAPESTLTRS